MVYEYFITRQHRKITWTTCSGGKTAAMTLVTPDPIPPVHFTCKLLCEEVVAYLEEKVTRMKVARMTPRLILHAENAGLLFREDGDLDDFFFCIENYRDPSLIKLNEVTYRLFRKDLDHAIFQPQSARDIDSLAAYVMRTARFLNSKTKEATSWYEEAISSLARFRSDWYDLPDIEQRLHVEVLARKTMAAPSAGSLHLQILILTGDKAEDQPGTLEIVENLAELCAIYGRQLLYTLLACRTETSPTLIKTAGSATMVLWTIRDLLKSGHEDCLTEAELEKSLVITTGSLVMHLQSSYDSTRYTESTETNTCGVYSLRVM